MNGIKMSDCRFYINEEERIVMCVIPHTKDMVVEYIHDHFSFPDLDLIPWNKSKIGITLSMPNSFTGKAMCAESDTWNEEIGKMIAFSRAKNKCYKSFFKRANAYVQAIDTRLGDIIEQFNTMGAKLDDKRVELDEQIKERLNDYEDDDEEEEE